MDNIVPVERIRAVNAAPVRARDFVLYWMVACRRLGWNFALDRAVWWAAELGKPLVVLEGLRCDYPWASDRLHRFVVDGMADNRRAAAAAGVTYLPFVEREKGQGRGLLEALASRACVVVTDDWPAFFIPRMVAVAGERLDVKLEAVDSNGLYPLASLDRTFHRAVDLRRFYQKHLPAHFLRWPAADPLSTLPRKRVRLGSLGERWPMATGAELDRPDRLIAELPIDHTIPVVPRRGGTAAAAAQLELFVDERLDRYGERHHPDAQASSELSPYLHFGHVGVHEIFSRVIAAESWSPLDCGLPARGAKRGWWGLSEAAEAFLDELIVWRDLGFNRCQRDPEHEQFSSLPTWAQRTLIKHQRDPRPYSYDLETLRAAGTHDPIWNAAQRELLVDGRIHNYLRMLWGKKVLEWSPSPRSALQALLELNNRHAVDGRDPNSSSGVLWVFGRHDRTWGERPIFGQVRYMSSDATRRKVRLKQYLARYAG